MPDQNPNSLDATPVQLSARGHRLLLPVFLSTISPGAGQFLVGQKRKGWALLIVFAFLICCIWPLRLPRFVAVLNVIALVWLVLSLYAGFSVFLRQNATSEQQSSKLWMAAIPALACIGIKLLLIPLLFVSGFQVLKFNSSAMESTLLEGDQFLADKVYYRHQAVARDDLVVLRRKEFLTVKRVIALPGDTIQCGNRKVLLNGDRVEEPFIQHTLTPGSNPELDTFGPFTIPTGKYFVMGDNRDVSLDSRMPDFGLLDAGDIMGRPLYIYASPRKSRSLRKLR